MSKRKLLYGGVLGMISAIMLVSLNISPVEASRRYDFVTESNTESVTSSRAAKLYWVTKTENGKTYKRLYDSTNKVYLTSWILVG